MHDTQLYKEWFEEIAEKASRLTTGNVAHLGATIRGLALNCAEWIATQVKSEENPADLGEEIKKFWEQDFNEDCGNYYKAVEQTASYFYELGKKSAKPAWKPSKEDMEHLVGAIASLRKDD